MITFKQVVNEFFNLDTTNVDDILDYFSSKYNMPKEAVKLGYYIGRIVAIVNYVLPIQGRVYLDLNIFQKDINMIKKLIKR